MQTASAETRLTSTASAALAPPTTWQITDDKGAVVRLGHAPRRIVSLAPSLTETVCDLGACERLVAVDRWSNWPQAVARLPHVGGLDDPNVEQIMALRPDLVLISPAARAAQRLRALGLVVAELDAQDLPGVRKVYTQVATLLGQPAQAGERWTHLQAQIDTQAARVPQQARGTRVYFEVSSTPYAASESSFIGQLLARLGARNVVPGKLGTFPLLNPEFVVRADPQLIVLPASEAAGLAARPGWAGMQALRLQRVCAIDASKYDVLARPGPRLGVAAQLLADCLLRATASASHLSASPSTQSKPLTTP